MFHKKNLHCALRRKKKGSENFQEYIIYLYT